MKNKTRNFLILAAICSFLGAVTTTLLIFLPNPVADNFESQVQLYKDALYMVKQWILFLHPQVNILACFGIALLLFKRFPLQMIIGTFFLVVWAYTEMSQQSLSIDALNQMWRPGYENANDPADRSTFFNLIKAAEGINDSHYFLVIYGFGLGSLFYGLAFIQIKDWSRAIGIALLFIGILSLSAFLGYYTEINFLKGFVNWSYTWIYPYLQPIVRIAIGFWILKEIRSFTL